eukprot:TRINITY_DN3041_c0_g1_i1.p1 TRINITY_DN3041_c0_g1~~TRINITY_DN3041_c0_g1_i1.p1  ORF type:complete len:638 (-),score=100.05 TRINITY_DN3041_c0_g1_i1:960-2873(-)
MEHLLLLRAAGAGIRAAARRAGGTAREHGVARGLGGGAAWPFSALRFAAMHGAFEFWRGLQLTPELLRSQREAASLLKFHERFGKEQLVTASTLHNLGSRLSTSGSKKNFTAALKEEQEYIQTGQTADAALILLGERNRASACGNPTFFAGSREYTFHYGSVPYTCFHQNVSFADLEHGECWQAQQRGDCQFMMANSLQQFYTWTSFLASRLSALPPRGPPFTLTLFSGDARDLCDILALGSHQTTFEDGDGEPLHLQPGVVPAQFDSVHTSNLVDSIGLLPLLIACAPVLKHSETAVLHTDTMLLGEQYPTVSDFIAGELRGMPLPLLSQLLGVTLALGISLPLSPRNACSVWRLDLSSAIGSLSDAPSRCFATIVWRVLPRVSPTTTLSLKDSPVLLDKLSQLLRQSAFGARPDLPQTWSIATWVRLLVAASWQNVCVDQDSLHDLIARCETSTDPLSKLAMAQLQEMYCLLHLHGLITAEALRVPSPIVEVRIPVDLALQAPTVVLCAIVYTHTCLSDASMFTALRIVRVADSTREVHFFVPRDLVVAPGAHIVVESFAYGRLPQPLGPCVDFPLSNTCTFNVEDDLSAVPVAAGERSESQFALALCSGRLDMDSRVSFGKSSKLAGLTARNCG